MKLLSLNIQHGCRTRVDLLPQRVTAVLICVFCAAFDLAKAADWSLVERGFIKAIPPAYAKHTTGFITNPTNEDVLGAIEFGKACKEKTEPLQYAYIFKSNSGFFANDSIYISIDTPLGLIAKHAQTQAQEYRPVDREYVAFLSKLPAVRLSISQQYISTRTWTAIATNRQLILLRDGERVETLPEVPAWRGGNPFPIETKYDKKTQATISAAQKSALTAMRSVFASGTDSTKRALLQTYRMVGTDDKTLQTGLGLSAEEFHRLLDDAADPVKTNYALAETDSVFSAKELNKPGMYEIVFREPKVGVLGGITEKEIHIPITFTRYK